MKTITETIGGAQSLLDINYNLQSCFEEYVTDEYKTFLHIIRAAETFLPVCMRVRKRTGRPPYEYYPFIRSTLAKRFFKIETTSNLIQRLKGEPNLRLLCGFEKVPSAPTFSRVFAVLSEEGVLDMGFDSLVKKAHEEIVVYHVNRDSTTIATREKVRVKQEKPAKKQKKKRGRPRKGEIREPKELPNLKKQLHEDAHTSLERLNKECARTKVRGLQEK